MTKIEKRFEEISAFFDKRVRAHGYSPLGCDYGSWETQKDRFNVMAAAAPLEGKSILDVGCGFGDFYEYLGTSLKNFDYLGIDLSKEMLETARERHPSGTFREVNLLSEDIEPRDIVIANGIFYLLGDDGWAHMQTIVERLFALAGEAVAFSSLSTRADRINEGEFYADPEQVLSFCLTLTPWVVLRHDYHPGDFSVYLYRDKQ